MSTNTSASQTPTRSFMLPSAPVFVGAVYAVSVLGLIAVFVGEILFTDHDPHASQGPIDSIVSVGLFGTAALVIAVGLSLWFKTTPERARVGAMVLAALSIISIPVFWSGAPGIFGACAAWLGGLTRGSHPQSGAARNAGLVGAFIALLDVVMAVGGVLLAGIL
jgi:hypothetical protein